MTSRLSRAPRPDSDSKRRLAVAIGKLNARTQRVLALYYQEGCTQAEVAEILGMAEARVERLLRVVTKRLRAEHDEANR